VLPFAAVGQAVVGGAGDRIGVQGAGEIRGLDHDTGLRIDFDFDLVAGHDTGGFRLALLRPRCLSGLRHDIRRLAEDPDMFQRFIADVGPDRIAGRWEASEDHGSTWRKDFDLIFERA
jgi:hypothetical protein